MKNTTGRHMCDNGSSDDAIQNITFVAVGRHYDTREFWSAKNDDKKSSEKRKKRNDEGNAVGRWET